MATIQDAVKRLTYQFTSTGADQVASDLNKVAASATTTSTASLSLENSFNKLESRYVSTIKAQQDFQKVQDTVNAAVAQNPALQDRANAVLEAAGAKYAAATGAAGAFSAVLDAGRGALLGYAAGGGALGAVLGSIPGWGTAAAVGIGLVATAFDYLSTHALAFGQEAVQLKQFADVTGLTTTEVRGLTEAGAALGVSGDQVGNAIEHFTAQLEQAKTGSGALFTELASINGGLAVQLAGSQSTAQALDILAKAYNSTTDATTRAALARDAFGKGSASVGPVLGSIGDAGGVATYAAAAEKATGITDELTTSAARLTNQIAALKKTNEDAMASIYAEPVLQRQLQFEQEQNKIIEALAKSAQAARAADAGAQAKGFYGSTLGIGAPSTDEFGNPFPVPTPAAPASPANAASPSPGAPSASGYNAATDAVTQLTTATDKLNEAQAAAAAAQANFSALEQSGTASADALKASRKSAGDALQALASLEQQHIASLNGAATGAEILQAKTDALTAAMMLGKTSADDYNRALHGDSAATLAKLQDQNHVLNAVAGRSRKPRKQKGEKQVRRSRPTIDNISRKMDDVRSHCAPAA